MTIKHFETTYPITKITIAYDYTDTSSNTAAKFLAYVKTPTTCLSHQSTQIAAVTLKKTSKQPMNKHAFNLFVLPPRSSVLNGDVERCNRAFRYEFYLLYDGLLNTIILCVFLDDHIETYNTFSPHQASNQDMSMTYYQKLGLETAQSHRY